MEQINKTTPIDSLRSIGPIQISIMMEGIYFVGDLLSKNVLEYFQSTRSHVSLISSIFLIYFFNQNNLHWEGEEEILFKKEDLYDKDIAGLLVMIDKRILKLKGLKYKLEAMDSAMNDLNKREMQHQCEEIKEEIKTLWQQALELKEPPSLK